jgi:hypothetical protein
MHCGLPSQSTPAAVAPPTIEAGSSCHRSVPSNFGGTVVPASSTGSMPVDL